MKFDVLNRFTGEVQFTADIDCADDAPQSVKLGLAVKWAVKAGADLAGANLAQADLAGAKNAELIIARTRILPEGDLIVWKACSGGVIVKLLVPKEARRSHAFGRKCRTEFADVLEVQGADEAIGMHDRKTVYRAGERVTCHEWDEDWTVECTGGIHFFLTREEAQAWA